MDLKYLFFDLDGTLIDSRTRLYTLFEDLTGDSKLSFDEYWSYKCAKKSNQWVLEEKLDYSDWMVQTFQELWMSKIEDDHYLAMDILFSNTVSCLEMFHGSCDLFVVSARQFSRKAELQLEMLGIAHFFKDVLITEQKRSKEELIRSLGLGLTQNNSVIIGDTGEETLAGKALEIFTVNTLTGFRNREVLASYQPDLIVDNLSGVCVEIFSSI